MFNNVNEVVENLGFMTMEQFLINSGTYKRRENFGSHNTVKAIKDDTLLITIQEFFDTNLIDDSNFSFIDSKNELKELLLDYDISNCESDNTYNYNSYLSNDLNFTIFKHNDLDSIIVGYRVHIGLDARWGYTDSIWVEYENEYDFNCHLSQLFSVNADIEVTNCDNEIGNVSIWISPISEEVSVYSNTLDIDLYPYELDLYDKNYLKESLELLLNEEGIEFKELTVK